MAIEIFRLPKRENEGCFSKMIAHTCTPFDDQKILVPSDDGGVSDDD
jgi:hypothetical protein